MKKVLSFILKLSIILLDIYLGIYICNWHKDNQENKDISKDISSFVTVKENDEYDVNFKDLKEKNNDVVGWLKVEGTSIDYPVVKSIDNDYYLERNFEKKFNKAGWIFADFKNKFDGTDKNIVIYGHNRKDGGMFGTLKNVLKEEWYNDPNNKYIKFITEDKSYNYRVFSVYMIKKETYYITTEFNDEEYLTFIETIKSRSKKDFGVELNDNDSILTLSTCADNDKYRVVLHAKKEI